MFFEKRFPFTRLLRLDMISLDRITKLDTQVGHSSVGLKNNLLIVRKVR